MRRTRYIAVVVGPMASRVFWEERLKEFVAATPDARWAVDASPLLVVVRGELARPIGKNGALIGSIFTRLTTGNLRFDRDTDGLGIREQNTMVSQNFWGGYVTMRRDAADNSVSVFRAPLGDLPCFWSKQKGAVLIGSDLSIMIEVGLDRPAFNAEATARYLAREDLRTCETCLQGIAEVRGGDMVTFVDGKAISDTLWSPWTFASTGRAIVNPNEAEQRVRDAALFCTHALAQEQGRVVVKLSGGLDSSIVAACLKASGRDLTAVNLVTADASGDEREYARLVATGLEIPLIEVFRDAARVAPDRSAGASLPRPSARSFTQETSRICADLAETTGSGAVFDGGGGDNVFCSLQSARPATDCAVMYGLGPLFWRTAAAIAELSQVSLWQVAKRSLSILFRRSAAYRWDVDVRFLSRQARDHAAKGVVHPWLEPPSKILPGKTAHVALLAAAQGVIEGFDAEDNLPTYSPLIVQPVIEACLEVPSWQWFEAGHNRAAARRAFDGYLPVETLKRRSKGAPDSFIAELYESNRSLIRNMLMGGLLMQRGLLDPDTLSVALDDPRPVRGHDFLRLMRLADAESWARCWV